MSQIEMAIKLKSGFGLLTGRSAITKLLQVVSSLLLAYKLFPADYGTFGILYGFISAMIFFTDIGLGDVLVQKKQDISRPELATYIGIRLLLGSFWMLVFALIYPYLLSYYKITFDYKEWVVFVALVLPLEAFIGAAIVKVQKDLNFKELARIELIETGCLYSLQIILAFLDFGLWSLFLAILCSRLLKTFLCLRILKEEWKPEFNFDLYSGNYKQGCYFQLNSIIPTSKAMVLPILLSFYLDLHTIGIIFWLSSLVSIPLVLAYNYNSVMFPALSKLQDDNISAKEIASRSMEKMIIALAFVFGVGGIVGDQIIALVFNTNWSDAKSLIFVCAFYHFAFSMRYMTYPLLYAKNLASKRTLVEVLLVVGEYVMVVLVCKTFKGQGYFASLAVLNVLSFYFFSMYVKDWMSSSTYKRFHLASLILITSFVVERSFNNPSASIYSLIVELASFTIFFIGALALFDKNFRHLVLNVKNKALANVN